MATICKRCGGMVPDRGPHVCGQWASAHIAKLEQELAAARAEADALGAWACDECGARFATAVNPTDLHGVQRCSSCVERDAARAEAARLREEVDVWHAQYERLGEKWEKAEVEAARLREAFARYARHDSDCGPWAGGCRCGYAPCKAALEGEVARDE